MKAKASHAEVMKSLAAQRRVVDRWLARLQRIPRADRKWRASFAKATKVLGFTFCIVCRKRIPKNRERRAQHTCSVECHRVYRLRRRKEKQARACRVCGRGLPKKLADDESVGVRCFYCARKMTHATVDRKVPRERGGSDAPENLVLCCGPCNRAKGEMTLAEFRKKRGKKRFPGELENYGKA